MTLHYIRADRHRLTTVDAGPENYNCMITQYTESGDALVSGIEPLGFWRIPCGTKGELSDAKFEGRWDRRMTTVAAGVSHFVIAKYRDDNRSTDMWICDNGMPGQYVPVPCVRRISISHLGLAMTDDSTTVYIGSRWFPRYPHIEVCDLVAHRLTRLTYRDFHPGRLCVRHGMLYAINVDTNVVHAVDRRASDESIVFSRTEYKVSAINPGLLSDTLLLHGHDAAAWYDLRACAEYEHESATYATRSRVYV